MISALIGFFTALPQLLILIKSAMEWINKTSGNDPAGFAIKLGSAFDDLSKAKTPEDHLDSAKAIADLIAGMPSK